MLKTILDSKDDQNIQGISPLNNSELEIITENDNYSINSTQPDVDKLSDEINSEDDTGYELFISLLPMSLRERARRLMSFIKKYDVLTWNLRGELIWLGKPIHGSHMSNLLLGTLLTTPNRNEPIGSDIFYSLLAKYNVPKSLLSNSNVKKRIIINDITKLDKERTDVKWLSWVK